MQPIRPFVAVALCAAACTATPRHDDSRASLDHDVARAALGPDRAALPPTAPPFTGHDLHQDQAIAQALARNPSFRAELLAAHDAALALDAVALGPTPMFMLETGVPLSGQASVPILALLTTSLTELVTRSDRMESASLRAQAAHLQAIDAAATLAATVRERYAMAWQAQEALRLARESEALASTDAGRTGTLSTSGMASTGRDQAARASLATAAAMLEQATAAHAAAMRALALAMGQGLDAAPWRLERPQLPPPAEATLLATSGQANTARAAVAFSAAVRIEAELVRSGLAQNGTIGSGYMEDEEGMKAIPIVLQFALPVGREGATRDERADLMQEAAQLKASAALQQAHVRLADALDRESAARSAAASIERAVLSSARAQHDRLRALAEAGAAAQRDRDMARLEAIDAERTVIESHTNACIASAQRVAASAGIDISASPTDWSAKQ